MCANKCLMSLHQLKINLHPPFKHLHQHKIMNVGVPFFCNLAPLSKNFTFRPLNDLMSFLDPLLGAISHGAEVTRLGAIAYGTEIPRALASRDILTDDVV